MAVLKENRGIVACSFPHFYQLYLSNIVNPLSSMHGNFLFGLIAATPGFFPAFPAAVNKIHSF